MRVERKASERAERDGGAMTARRLALLAAGAALVVAIAAPPLRAAAVAVTWLPAPGAIGYRIETATREGGPWKLYRDAAPTEGRPSALQVFAVDGFRARGRACVRVSTISPGPVYSTPTEAACVTLPRVAVDFSTLGGAPPAPPAPAPVPAPVFAYCAAEGEPCAFTGTRRVRYGNDGTFAVLTLTNGATCSNSTFGDPLPGRWKYCEVEQ
ncbi:MAG: hypothetical protein E6R03_06360 [Hyphomicrobiaceae bacterium]|nr:MAG: hypothetical protein E6R03_06360 [Hyphomicrobiaceae bacterium]